MAEELDSTFSMSYDVTHKVTRVMAFDPYYNRGWQSAEIPTTPNKVVAKKISINSAEDYKWVFQTKSGLIGIN